MPLDLKPCYLLQRDAENGLDLVVTARGEVVRGRILCETIPHLRHDAAKFAVGRKSHFATCPDAALHRKERGKVR